MYGSAHLIEGNFHITEASVRLRTQWGGWGLWLGAGEGLAKAREELTRGQASRTIHLKTALSGLSSSSSSRVNNLHQLYLIFALKVAIHSLVNRPILQQAHDHDCGGEMSWLISGKAGGGIPIWVGTKPSMSLLVQTAKSL